MKILAANGQDTMKILDSVSAGATSCTVSEQASVQNMDADTLGAASDKCGHSSLTLTGINHDKFNTCLSDAIGIGKACSECWKPAR